MPHVYLGNMYRKIHVFVLSISILAHCPAISALSSLAKNDAYPVFTTLDPHAFLDMAKRIKYRDEEHAEAKKENASIAVSPFGQNADRGKSIAAEPRVVSLTGQPEPTQPLANQLIELGDLTGRTSMIALLFGSAPAGKSLATTSPTLAEAREFFFPGQPEPIEDPTKIDPEQKFAYFSFPLTYRKRGVALDFSVRLFGDLGLNIKTRVSNIRQTVREFRDLTAESSDDATKMIDFEVKDVENLLMKELREIAREIGLDIGNFNETSIEELRAGLFWQHVYEINSNQDDWPHYLFIPFVQLTGSASPGKKRELRKLFGLPFGNNDHSAIGFTAGLNFDFVDTIEVGVEVGVTHFFDHDFTDVFVPNDKFQRNIYPYRTDITVSPGHNWHFGAKISAYHFLDNLSFYFQYIMIEHEADDVKLKKNDPAFVPELLNRISSFHTKIANIAFNYDISPNATLGFLWQAPLEQRNSYRSTTLMLGFNVTF